MKKLFAIILSLVLVMSMGMTAFAASFDMLYVDISAVKDATRTIDEVWLYAYDSSNDSLVNGKTMTCEWGDIYSCDYTSNTDPAIICIVIAYTEGASSEFNSTGYEANCDFYTVTGNRSGNWGVYAEPNVATDGGSVNADVRGTYVAAGEAGTKYSVDIEWSGLSFTYNAETKEWNTDTHSYDVTGGSWAEGTGSITVTNHSNIAITATPTWTPGTDYSSVTLGFTYSNGESALNVAAATEGTDEQNGTASSGTITVTPGGSLASTANNTVIGTITVTIAGVETE